MQQSPFTKVGPNKKTCQLCHTPTPTDYKLWWQCFLQFGDGIVFQMFCFGILVVNVCPYWNIVPCEPFPTRVHLPPLSTWPWPTSIGCHSVPHQAATKTWCGSIGWYTRLLPRRPKHRLAPTYPAEPSQAQHTNASTPLYCHRFITTFPRFFWKLAVS